MRVNNRSRIGAQRTSLHLSLLARLRQEDLYKAASRNKPLKEALVVLTGRKRYFQPFYTQQEIDTLFKRRVATEIYEVLAMTPAELKARGKGEEKEEKETWEAFFKNKKAMIQMQEECLKDESSPTEREKIRKELIEIGETLLITEHWLYHHQDVLARILNMPFID